MEVVGPRGLLAWLAGRGARVVVERGGERRVVEGPGVLAVRMARVSLCEGECGYVVKLVEPGWSPAGLHAPPELRAAALVVRSVECEGGSPVLADYVVVPGRRPPLDLAGALCRAAECGRFEVAPAGEPVVYVPGDGVADLVERSLRMAFLARA